MTRALFFGLVFALGCSADDVRARRIEGTALQFAPATVRGAQAEEWWRPTPAGLEHGVDVASRPEGEGPLVVSIAVDGATRGRLADGGRTLVFGDAEGGMVRYGDLYALDAAHRALPARMEWRPGEVRLVVDDAAAEYPVRIDPLVTTPAWVAGADRDWAWFAGSVDSAGDVDGDGFADVVVGADLYDHSGTGGKVFVYGGSAGGLGSDPTWTATPGGGAYFGGCVAGIGDVDGNGYDDVAVGQTAWDGAAGENTGRAVVYLGAAGGLAAAPGWSIEGDAVMQGYGEWVGGAGDVNADGYDDLVVGVATASRLDTADGRAELFLGSASGLSDAPDWITYGSGDRTYYGRSIAGVGDVDGDGYGDVVVGADGASTAWLHRGGPSGLEDAPTWTASPAGTTFFGSRVAAAGDVNGDGHSDVLVGDYGSDQAFLYLGGAGGLEADASWIGSVGSGFGSAVDGIGDLDGDGFDDVAIGADNDATVYVYYGSAAGLPDDPSVTLPSDQAFSAFGRSVAGAGDVDGDGRPDLVVGAPMYDDGVGEGRAVLYVSEPPCDVDGDPCAGGLCHAGECDPASCFIDGVFYDDGDASAGDGCLVCDVGTSRVAWTTAAEGTACAGGLCRAGACDADSCRIAGAWWDDGAASPGSECQTCAVASSRTAWTNDAEGTDCAGGLCRTGACDSTRCFIGATWYLGGAADPGNDCRACRTATSRREWTSDADGSACAGGICHLGDCDPDVCFLGDWFSVDGREDPENECQACRVASSRLGWTWDADGTECADGLCRAGACDANECFVDGSWRAPDEIDPAAPCSECRPVDARTAWSERADGAECPEGVCNAGDCDEKHCFVDGSFVEDGASIAGGCQECILGRSRTGWTTSPDGKACDDGALWTEDDFCTAGVCAGIERGGCARPIEVQALPFEAEGTTEGRASDTGSYAACGGRQGPGADVAYAVPVEGGKTYRVEVRPAPGFDALVAVTGTCEGAPACLAAGDGGAAGASETASFDVEDDGFVFVVVDAASEDAAGGYQIEIREVPPAAPGCACRAGASGGGAGAAWMGMVAAIFAARRKRTQRGERR